MSTTTSIYIIQKSHLSILLGILVCVAFIWMIRSNGQEKQSNQPNQPIVNPSPPRQERIYTPGKIPGIISDHDIPTVGTSGMWIHMILDESGSMSSVRDSTIHALNHYMEKQKIETSTNQVHVSLMKFEGGRTPIVYDRIPLHRVSALDHSTYIPGQDTNLYDAIGRTILRIDQQLLQSSSIYQRPAVLVVILTDGMENASRYFTQYQIQKMIKQRRDAGWKFIFLGANIDAGNVADGIGIARSAAIKIDVKDTSYSEALDQSTKSWRKSAEKVQTYAQAQPAAMSSSSYASMMATEAEADFSDAVRKQYERP